jgi:hypothetical protein
MRYAVGETWAGLGSISVTFFPGMAGHPYPTLRATFLSLSKENRQISERMIAARPSYQGVRRSVRDPETFAPGRRHVPRGVPSPGSGSVIVMYRWLFEPSCVRHSCHMAKRKVGV